MVHLQGFPQLHEGGPNAGLRRPHGDPFELGNLGAALAAEVGELEGRSLPGGEGLHGPAGAVGQIPALRVFLRAWLGRHTLTNVSCTRSSAWPVLPSITIPSP